MTNDNFSNFKTSSVVVVVDNVAAVVAATNTEERERESFLIQEPSHISIIPFR